ncbi:MAG: TipAS antibiotic-recognition domain-containing protein [Actinobacteria bacterium]|uniref:Unannotated protein n=1 Tax=freshwater metagenome TaxID=449393 RepID=A0A6J6DER5_9ZZZZ|nr:TipAS antibiotic-recognition domain-containing protein [Actinomycetota bacterium]
MSNLFGYHSGQYVNNYSEAENKQFTAAFSQITEGFRVAMEQGLGAEDEKVQELVRQHYEFCLQFWKPDRDSYKSLAMSYILPSPYQESYEAVANGLGQYHYDAMVIFADKNL